MSSERPLRYPTWTGPSRARVSPHTIRHTTATHLLRSSVHINAIGAWLGHVSLQTTNVYAEVRLSAVDPAACVPAGRP